MDSNEDFDKLTSSYPCPNCGSYRLTRDAKLMLQDIGRQQPDKLAVISHAVRKITERSRKPLISASLLKQICETSSLPSPAEQVTNLLIWLGENQRYFGDQVQMSPDTHAAVVGAAGADNFFYVAQELMARGFFKGAAASGAHYHGSLTFAGWDAYERLKRRGAGTRKAFMAMPFGDEQLDRVFAVCFKPSATLAGFDLRRLDEVPSAGLIDNRLRVEIRTSRFLVADLTQANLGAYWEAGFAEGLGKPVIYTCEKRFFEAESTHFDTSHHQTVLWSATDLPAAAKALTTTIRATLPDEAVMEDPVDQQATSS